MIYKIFAPLIAPYYGIARKLMSLMSKVFFFYGTIIAVMAFAGDRGLVSLPIYGRWIAYSIALRLLIVMGDALVRRVRMAFAPTFRLQR